MRISDWSSDVCSSDLKGFGVALLLRPDCGGQFPDRAASVHIPKASTDSGTNRRGAVGRHKDLRRSGNQLLHQYALTVGLQPALDFIRSEEHTSELQSLMRISYAVFCLKKKQTNTYKRDKIRTTTALTIN